MIRPVLISLNQSRRTLSTLSACVAGRRRLRGESGQSLMEFALVFPVLFLLLVGVTFIAQGFNLQMVLYGAAYEGARVMARNPTIGSGNYCSPPACNPDQSGRHQFRDVCAFRWSASMWPTTDLTEARSHFYSKDARGYQNSLRPCQ
jgi:hypothetical protein